MEMQELEITIDKEGRVHVAVLGIKGEGCLAATRDLEKSLGAVEERGHTAEYYEQPVVIQNYQHLGQK